MKNTLKHTTLGIQHLLAMYAGAVIVPLIIGGALGFNANELTYLVSIDILMCGIATILQITSSRFIGIGLPVVLGCTFTAVGPIIAIGGQFGVSAVYGSVIASGIIVVLVSSFFGKLVKFFPPVVTGSVVTVIGITLIPVAVNNLGGGDGASDFGSLSNILLGFGTLLLIILIYRFSSGFIRSISILLGLVAGTVVAVVMGKVDFTPVTEASFFHVVEPFHFGFPTFEWPAILTMTLVAMVSLVESTGVYFALGDICEKDLQEQDLTKGYRAEGLAAIIGGIFNAFPYTTFSQNVGLLQMSGIRSRKVILLTGLMLVALGFLPKIAALATIIPASVLGGAMIAMFGMVVSQGIKMLSGIIADSQENSMIIACSVGMGLGVTVAPDLFVNLPSSIQILTSNGIVAGSITAIALNIMFNMLPARKRKRTSVLYEQEA
ncbi:purine permease [Virgibacillus dakarensis]|uniref:nucleobase:cation symporter-2 family protein n=1 Tax=Virgibacillus dakarensis TaxID=1917889 RepID=UPI0012D856D5|nr:nucleobase:cation symporter-2 family protein [Virgibacillus dakarensis]MBT2217779.1 purine permease [Virgibacillus dakarensis]MTW87133.1 purine permease [Virgibacillus dakarensis]